MWRETTKHERNRTIWRDELEDFVPPRVLDFHVHVFNEATLPENETFACGGHPIRQYDFDDLGQDLAECYPGRETLAVCFGLPDVEYDKAENDRYVGAGCDRKRFFGLRLIDPAEDPDLVRREVVEGRFIGFKPYLNYVRDKAVNDIEVDDMLPAGIMQVADELGLVIMLHIPRSGRLADPVNREQVIRLCETYPRARVVLAHVGRAYYLRNVVGNLDPLKHLSNLYVDLAMVMNADVLEHTFATFPAERILYGTDIPIAVAPGHSVEINHQYTYVTPVPWKLSISDDHRKLVFTSFLYEELRAIRKAAERVGLSRQTIEAIFYDNGMRLLKEVL